MNIINSKEIEVLDATLSGVMNNDGVIEWYINIDCGTTYFDGISTKPRLYLERFEWGITCIKEILTSKIIIEEGSRLSNNTMLPGERLCCLYAFEHQFLNYKNGDLHVTWRAMNSNIYPDKFKIEMDTKIDFLGFNLGEIDLESAIRNIKFNTSGLVYYQEDGTLYLIPEGNE
ncbi:hypothetical protein [Paenibacillus aestuarii]|uniref:Uncharacterized protein n=1 Tax=Paenibacillus aestuarii TaxID=516965 RepID=A0ABW0KHW6_9BACL|nr:hypothetical protein [Paenibacillus aestuarii]